MQVERERPRSQRPGHRFRALVKKQQSLTQSRKGCIGIKAQACHASSLISEAEAATHRWFFIPRFAIFATSREASAAIRLGLLVRIAAGMQAELDQFFTHGQAGYADPARGLGLITVGQLDCPAEEFLFASR